MIFLKVDTKFIVTYISQMYCIGKNTDVDNTFQTMAEFQKIHRVLVQDKMSKCTESGSMYWKLLNYVSINVKEFVVNKLLKYWSCEYF